MLRPGSQGQLRDLPKAGVGPASLVRRGQRCSRELLDLWERLVICCVMEMNVFGAHEMAQTKKSRWISVAGEKQGGNWNNEVSRSGNCPLPFGVYLYSFKALVDPRVCFGSCPGLDRTFPASDPCNSVSPAWPGALVGLENQLQATEADLLGSGLLSLGSFLESMGSGKELPRVGEHGGAQVW